MKARLAARPVLRHRDETIQGRVFYVAVWRCCYARDYETGRRLGETLERAALLSDLAALQCTEVKSQRQNKTSPTVRSSTPAKKARNPWFPWESDR